MPWNCLPFLSQISTRWPCRSICSFIFIRILEQLLLTLSKETLYGRFLVSDLFFKCFYFIILFLDLIEKLFSFVFWFSPRAFYLDQLLLCKTKLLNHFLRMFLHVSYLIFIILHIRLWTRTLFLMTIHFTLHF